jgi:DNA-directed RNA polymerase subunit RPC12/RpoP
MPQTIKCPNCGASLVYQEGTDSLMCPYCGTKVPIRDIPKGSGSSENGAEKGAPAFSGRSSGTGRASGRAAQAGPDSRTAGAGETSGASEAAGQSKDTVTFHCSSCGAELITSAHTAATVCPFCGSPAILEDRLSGRNRPQSLIPFQYNRDKAREEFRRWTRSGFFTPRGFGRSSTLDAIEGIYVPCWLFDMQAEAHMEAKGSIVRSHREGDYMVTETDHYLLSRDTEASFARIPADASEQMPDETMDSLEPYQYDALRDFEPSYLSGYMAENSNYAPETLQPRAEKRADEAIAAQTRATMTGFTGVVIVNSQIREKVSAQEYSMFPVWVLQYRYRGKNWKLYLNGQTGRRIGSLPVDSGRVVLCFLLCFAVIFGLSALINLMLL